MSTIEIAAVVLTLTSVALAARQSILNWPVGMVSVCLFGCMFWHAHLYAAAILQSIYFVQSIWGWAQWSRPQAPIQNMDGETMAYWIDLLIWGTGFVYILLVPCGSPAPFLDAATFVLSLFATYLLIYRFVQTWLVWMVVNVLYFALFTSQGLPLTAALSAVLLVINIVALFSWKRAPVSA